MTLSKYYNMLPDLLVCHKLYRKADLNHELVSHNGPLSRDQLCILHDLSDQRQEEKGMNYQ